MPSSSFTAKYQVGPLWLDVMMIRRLEVRKDGLGEDTVREVVLWYRHLHVMVHLMTHRNEQLTTSKIYIYLYN